MDDIYLRDERVPVADDIEWSILGPSMPDGVYFGLSHEDYLAVGAISSSLMRSAVMSPLTAWTKHISPDYRKDSTPAQDEGTALHKRVLEGEEAFRSICAVPPENDGTYADGLTELREICKTKGLKVAGSVMDLCVRILAEDPEAKLWPLIMQRFNTQSAGKIVLKPDVWQRLEFRARLIRIHPTVADAIVDGFPEVSVFWHDENGIPKKARFDWLKTDWLVDLKYFANINERPVEKMVNSIIPNYRIQARHYIEGTERAKELMRAGKVFGVSPDSEWKEAFMASPEHRFLWIFVQKGDVPEIEAVEFSKGISGASLNDYWVDAERKIDHAQEIILSCLKTYGSDPWMVPRPIRVLTDAEQVWSIG